jgi:hypothetical protein
MLRKQMVAMAFDPEVHRRPLRGLILHKEYTLRRSEGCGYASDSYSSHQQLTPCPPETA